MTPKMKLLNEIERYLELGWKILPVHAMKNGKCTCGKANCESPGKHPRSAHGVTDASTDPEQILKWINKFPGCNWGVACGASNLAVLDIDPRSGGDLSFDELNFAPFDTPEVWTGGDGRHIYFSTNSDQVKSRTLAPGLELRSKGYYVILPPSIHPSGKAYQWKIEPWDIEIIELPKALIIDNEAPPAYKAEGQIAVGNRNSFLTSQAGILRRAGLSEEAIYSAISVTNKDRLSDPLDDKEVREIARSIARYSPPDKPVLPAPPSAPPKSQREFHYTDLGNSERLIEEYGSNIRYAHDRGTWLVWDGKHWARDQIELVERLAKDTIRKMYRDASDIQDNAARKALAKWALSSETRSRITSMVELTKSEVPILHAELDQDPLLVNVQNGTINLRTGELQPHDRDQLITKLIDVPYMPEIRSSYWESFLEMVTGGDRELQNFLQIAVGYSITGKTDEHCFFMLHGTGQNGKTTFTEAIRRLFGDYAHRTDIEAIMTHWKSSGGATPYIAGLAGARFVIGSEIPEGRKLNESLVKDLTGGDSISARFLHANPFTFEPTHKIWIFGNYKPKITGTDLGIWRRVRIIPFKTTIPEPRPMDEVLSEFEIEAEGILTWAIEGALRWMKTGLPDPEAVTVATDDYRTEQDIFQQFLDECCLMHPNNNIEKDELFGAMRAWAKENNEDDLAKRSKSWVTRQLAARGISQDGGRRNYLGVGMTIPLEMEPKND